MVKFVGLSATIGLDNYFVTAGTLYADLFAGDFALVGTPSAIVTDSNVAIISPPVGISMAGSFQTELDGPPTSINPTEYTGTVHSIIGSYNSALTFKLSKLDLSLSSLLATSGAADANAVVADIFKGDDTIIGSEASDNVRGHAGNDKMFGNGGSDMLIGDNGRDLIDGGLGDDTLSGRNGRDIFRFSTAIGPASNVDTIRDFEHKDQIQLKHSIFTKLFPDSSGHLKAANFHLGPAAADANDYVVYDNTNGSLYYDQDGNGAGAPMLFAIVYSDSGSLPAILARGDFDLI